LLITGCKSKGKQYRSLAANLEDDAMLQFRELIYEKYKMMNYGNNFKIKAERI
jgi:hypothetical protein